VRLFEVRDRSGALIGRGKIFNDVTRHNEAELVKLLYRSDGQSVYTSSEIF
jgi:hypothetical protein